MAKAGRKPKYTDPEEMSAAIEGYFADCEGELLTGEDDRPILNKWGEPVYLGQHPPTVTGLALALGFSSRQSLLEYQGKKAFGELITRAKLRIEEYNERRLYDRDGARGAEFNLRHNFRWREQEVREDRSAQGVILMPPVEAEDGQA